MQALPEIEYLDEPNEPAPEVQERNRRNGWIAALVWILLILLMLAASVAGLWWLRKDMTAEVDAVRAQQQSAAYDIAALQSSQAQESEIIAAYDQRIEETERQLAAVRGDNAQALDVLERLEHRVTDLAKAFEQLEAQRREISRVQAAPRPVATKPRPAPIKVQPAELVSISSFGGMASVTLKVGSEVSDLLMPGDRFRDWEFLSADPGARIAIFEVAGQTQELRL